MASSLLPVLTSGGDDSLEQLLSSLCLLESVVSEVFSTIDGRVKAEQKRINTIGNRLAAQQKKIEQLGKTTTQATCVLSPSRYPSASQLEPSTDLFDTSDRKEILPRSTNKKTAKFSAFDAKPLTLAGEVDILFGEGGYKSSRRTGGRKVDSSIDSCADLLLFNSTSSPYEAPTTDDEVEVSEKSSNLDRMKYASAQRMEALANSRRSMKESPMALIPPPPSISGGDTMIREDPYRPHYIPKARRWEMNFPINIPQLRNVASNVTCDEIPDFTEEDFYPSAFEVTSVLSSVDSSSEKRREETGPPQPHPHPVTTTTTTTAIPSTTTTISSTALSVKVELPDVVVDREQEKKNVVSVVPPQPTPVLPGPSFNIPIAPTPPKVEVIAPTNLPSANELHGYGDSEFCDLDVGQLVIEQKAKLRPVLHETGENELQQQQQQAAPVDEGAPLPEWGESDGEADAPEEDNEEPEAIAQETFEDFATELKKKLGLMRRFLA